MVWGVPTHPCGCMSNRAALKHDELARLVTFWLLKAIACELRLLILLHGGTV